MSIEYKSIPFEVKAIDADAGTFEGYASVFNNEDSHGDIVAPGAFTKTLMERKGRVKVLWQHDPHTPIGVPLEMREDNYGLFTKSKISDTQHGRDALTLLRDGVVTEMSIGYTPIKWEWSDEKRLKRRLNEIKLFEYSPVTIAANDMAVVTGVKSINEFYALASRARDLSEELKAGRVLSEKNRTLVQDCMSSLTGAATLLQALLEASEPDSTQKSAAAQTATEPEELHSLLQQLRSTAGLFKAA